MIRSAAIFMLLLVATSVSAHTTSTSYLSMDTRAANLTGHWEVALQDLELIIGLDRDLDGAVTWAELQHMQPRLYALLTDSVRLTQAGKSCVMHPENLLVNQRGGVSLAVIAFSTACESSQPFKLAYSFMFVEDAFHKNLLSISHSAGTVTHVLDATHSRYHFDPLSSETGAPFLEFTQQGIWHVLIGADHVLFVICLVLSVTLVRGSTTPLSLRQRGKTLLTLITAFTLAHSITLTLAASRVISLPTEIIEPAIAASVVLAALANLLPRFALHGWGFAFVFGLLHGFGFANVLAELPIEPGGFMISLLGFNLGVEMGQLLIVTLVFPPLVLLARRPQIQRRMAVAASVIIVLFGATWLVERTLAVV